MKTTTQAFPYTLRQMLTEIITMREDKAAWREIEIEAGYCLDAPDAIPSGGTAGRTIHAGNQVLQIEMATMRRSNV